VKETERSILVFQRMISHAAELRENAAECRALAVVTKAPEIREQLLEVADQFDRLARHYLFYSSR
jgi:hypothetical protein